METEKLIIAHQVRNRKRRKKGCSIQHKNNLALKNKKRRERSVMCGGTKSLSSLGHAKKEMSEKEKAFFGKG